MTSTKTSGCSISIFIVIAHAKGSHIETIFPIILRITNHVHYVLFAPTPKPMNCYLHRAVYKNAILHSTALILKSWLGATGQSRLLHTPTTPRLRLAFGVPQSPIC